MINEKATLNIKLIEEKINSKFLELKYNFESQNQEMILKLKELNQRLDMFSHKNRNKPNLNENYNDNNINISNKKADEIKNDNNEFKKILEKTNNEFNLIKIRFSEIINFIRDKNFWKQFISNIIEENKNNNKNKSLDKTIENTNNKINNIYAPFNYYIYFGIEQNKNFVDEASNTTHIGNFHKILENNNRNKNIDVKNILINEQINYSLDNKKNKTPNNIPKLKIMKNLNKNMKKNYSSLFQNKSFKKIQRNTITKNEHHSVNYEDNQDRIINAINNKIDSSYEKINDLYEKKAKINDFLVQANFINNHIDINKNRNQSDNLSEEYIQKQSQKIKKIVLSKIDKKYYQTLPLSLKYNLKNRRDMNHFNIISSKDLLKGNIEDLYYSQLKKDKINHLSNISGLNFKTLGFGDNIKKIDKHNF